MKTRIVRQKDGIEIQVGQTGSHTDELMAALKECQEGRCSCPTQEYDKVESLRIERSQEGIALTVKAKTGKRIDVREIEKCLEHTKSRIG